MPSPHRGSTARSPPRSCRDPLRCAANRRAPASPSVLPSTDASTSVFRDGRPLITRASSSRAAVSAALPVASGTDCESRAAMITIWSRDSPGRRAITFTSRSPFSVHESTVVWKPSPSSARKRSARSRAAAALSSAARAAVRVPLDDPAQLAERHVPVEQHVGGESLRHRPRPVLEREHHEHHRQDGRDERRAVDPWLDHGANLQFP